MPHEIAQGISDTESPPSSVPPWQGAGNLNDGVAAVPPQGKGSLEPAAPSGPSGSQAKP